MPPVEIRDLVEKAHESQSDVGAASALQDAGQKEQDKILQNSSGIKPPYDPTKLLRIWENSGALSPNIQAYVTNIDGLGHDLEPVIDMDSDEAWEQIRDAMWLERMHESSDGDEPPDDADKLMPSEQEVDEKRASLEKRARLEKLRLDAFLSAASPDGSFVTLRRETRQDREVTGNAYWEVVRNKRGQISRFVRVDPSYVRATKKDKTPVTVTDHIPFGPLGWDKVPQKRFFRRYVQAVGSSAVWFKEFGDPRIVGRNTGKVYNDIYQFNNDAEQGDEPASELIHFRTYATGNVYGMPRWIGYALAAMGSHAADEVNYMYFDNKAVPPIAVLVSGGGLQDDDVERIQREVRERIKGRENYHSILVLQAKKSEGDMSPGTPTIDIKDLSNAQEGDALFQKYDERNIDKIGQAFRMPRLVRGDVNEVNRASALASLRFADEQVFEPERQEFDAWMNRSILPLLGIRLWRFRSRGPQTRDPEMLSKIVDQHTARGNIVPNEARPILQSILGHDLPKRDEPWADQPMPLVQAGIAPAGTFGGEGDDDDRNTDPDAETDPPPSDEDNDGDNDGGASDAQTQNADETKRVLANLRRRGHREMAKRLTTHTADDGALQGIEGIGHVYESEGQ